MNDTIGIILTGGKNTKLKELAEFRTSSAIPIGGKYRAIDFVLSNMVNSGISSIGILTQYNFRSLMDHLGSGKEWDLDRRNGGLFVFPPYLSGDESGWYKGSADAMYNNITFLKRSFQEYVLVAQGNCIYKMIFDELHDFHIDNNADITIVYKDMYDYVDKELTNLGQIRLNNENRIIDFQEKPHEVNYRTCSMGIYFIKRKLLISILEECVAHGNYDFVKDILIKKIGSLKILGYKFDRYWRNLSTVNMYYNCNMELLNPEIRHELFLDNGKVYTKVKDEFPAKFNEEANVKNSIIADGCIIEGEVVNSVLFRGVTVKKGALIKYSILMQGTVVEENALLEHTILDKDVYITNNIHLKGAKEWPLIIGKNAIV